MCYCRHFFSSFFHSFLCFTHEKKVVECARTHTNNGMHRRNRISSWIFFSFLFRRQSDRRAHKEQFAFSLFRCIVAHAKKKPNMNIISNAYFFCVYCSFSFFSVSFRYFANYCFHSICWFSFHCVFRLILLPFRFRTFLFFKLIANSSIELLSVFTVLISQIFLSSFMIGIKKVD